MLTQYDVDPERQLLLLVQHPVTIQSERAGDQMAVTLDAVEEFDVQTVIIYPNSDAGSDQIISEIESRTFDSNIQLFQSLPRREYLGLMAAADVMVGNSSSGIIEAPSFDLPVVDIGPRQDGRERAANVRSVPHDTEAIQKAIFDSLEDQSTQQRAKECENPYEYGGAGKKITGKLSQVEINERLLRKESDFDY